MKNKSTKQTIVFESQKELNKFLKTNTVFLPGRKDTIYPFPFKLEKNEEGPWEISEETIAKIKF